MTESPQDAFERGLAAGKIEQKLTEHDQHFTKINGSLDTLGGEMHQLVLAVQRLGDEATAREATVVTTAAALKTAEDVRRDTDTASMSPLTRFLSALAGLGVVVGIVVGVAALLK